MPSDVHIDRPGGRFGRRDLLRTVAEGTAGAVGDEFLRCLVRHVALAFDAKFAFVAEAADPGGQHVRVLSGWYEGDWMDEPFEYDTRGKPCALVVERSVVAFPEALTSASPRPSRRSRWASRATSRCACGRPTARISGTWRDGRGADGGRGRGRRGDADLRLAGRRRARAPPSGGGVAPLARARDRGRRLRAPARGARPARRRAAAARGGGEPAQGGAAPARPRRSAGRRAAPAERGARRGPGRVARPRARAAPGGALRARAAQRARIADPDPRSR